MNSFKFLKQIFFIAITVVFSGCTTYYIPVDSFKDQFKGIDSTKLIIVKTEGPGGFVSQYKANPLKYIKCIDKDSNIVELRNSPSLEIRFTLFDGSRTTFYFDYIYMENYYVVGDKSRIVTMKRKIPIDSVQTIEIQDGHKDYHYVY